MNDGTTCFLLVGHTTMHGRCACVRAYISVALCVFCVPRRCVLCTVRSVGRHCLVTVECRSVGCVLSACSCVLGVGKTVPRLK